ncbi:M15 family metallopeptidase [Flavobacterium sp. JAS]|uniref:M15 family metallopeptidase n=1 Tax=Flavobacterium sp. JAS TaxID=2897329 RepID=UPI001E3E74BA|nr:M15 family metallopeptidase [Flavobacterium sp. JAS]MCD0468551.1 M15 family metallopeptidase [Flavobacterium sp. JAS]
MKINLGTYSASLLLLLFLGFFLSVASVNAQNEVHTTEIKQEIADTTFVNLKDYSQDFIYDMKYATEDNFLKAKVYDCAECMLRYKTVKALITANKEFMKQGCKIKLFDCYRPLSIQKKMWEIVSNPEYVADPKKGSIHNRGGAVDITLVNDKGEEIEMGTPFDFFGIQASHNYKKFPVSVRANRKYLKSIMIQSGFNSFDSEWWHYNLKTGLNDKVSNQKWDCN